MVYASPFPNFPCPAQPILSCLSFLSVLQIQMCSDLYLWRPSGCGFIITFFGLKIQLSFSGCTVAANAMAILTVLLK
jgi:hypothetical protein